ncbi:MAG: DmsC/YnfH family molybdoenzyme membrane anchor subunit, partial [Rhodospirillales bacterium]
KIGRKLRAFYVVLKPQNSWMSREVYAVGLLYLAGLIDYFSPSNFMHLIVAIAALTFLYCQARILHSAKGIPTWRAPKIPWILLATGFYEGFGLLAIYSFIYPQSIPLPSILPVGGLILAAINALLWQNYMMSLGDVGVGQKSQNLLLASTFKIQFISYLLPSILAMIFLVWGNEASWTLAAAGILVVVGSINWKILLITKACHQQGYAIAKFPQRGSGRYAAPTLSKN